MASRLSLQSELQALIGVRTDGKQNVYFQPPESVKLNYPCIVYKKRPASILRADNKPYKYMQGYDVTTITFDPDSDLSKRVICYFEHCRPDRNFVNDNLYHDALVLYY